MNSLISLLPVEQIKHLLILSAKSFIKTKLVLISMWREELPWNCTQKLVTDWNCPSNLCATIADRQVGVDYKQVVPLWSWSPIYQISQMLKVPLVSKEVTYILLLWPIITGYGNVKSCSLSLLYLTNLTNSSSFQNGKRIVLHFLAGLPNIQGQFKSTLSQVVLGKFAHWGL